MIVLGKKVRDKVTNLTGTAIAKADYLYGCKWVLVVADKTHNGKPVEVWLDEERLTHTRGKAVKVKKTPRGGPVPAMPSPTFPDPGAD